MTIRMLSALQRSSLGRQVIRMLAGKVPDRPVTTFGLKFRNEIGLAAGFDKDGKAVIGLGNLGFGHIEVGTVTPRWQPGNPKPRVFRMIEDKALVNRMGFPNQGVDKTVERLKWVNRHKKDLVIGISLGKQKETPLPESAADYCTVMSKVYGYADYLAINISSPNTEGLRELQRKFLGELLQDLVTRNEQLALDRGCVRRPLLIKISPDLSLTDLDRVLDHASLYSIDGLIATNTTLSRNGLRHPGPCEAGGLSGKPLSEASDRLIAHIVKQTSGRLPVIGVGGIFSSEDAKRKLDAGAVLVQIYTGLVYEGPRIVGKIAKGLV